MLAGGSYVTRQTMIAAARNPDAFTGAAADTVQSRPHSLSLDRPERHHQRSHHHQQQQQQYQPQPHHAPPQHHQRPAHHLPAASPHSGVRKVGRGSHLVSPNKPIGAAGYHMRPVPAGVGAAAAGHKRRRDGGGGGGGGGTAGDGNVRENRVRMKHTVRATRLMCPACVWFCPVLNAHRPHAVMVSGDMFRRYHYGGVHGRHVKLVHHECIMNASGCNGCIWMHWPFKAVPSPLRTFGV